MSNPNPYGHVEEELRPNHELPYSGWWAVAAGVLTGILSRLIFSGEPEKAFSAMLNSFVIGSPLFVGIITVYVAELRQRRSWTYYFIVPALANCLYVFGTLVLHVEGSSARSSSFRCSSFSGASAAC